MLLGFPRRLGLIACAALATAPCLAADEPVLLRHGDVREVRMDPARTDSYTLRLERDGSAEVVVLQQGIDLVVVVLDPAGKTIASVDSPNGREGDEPVAFEAAEAGLYELRVRAIAPNEPSGNYRITVVNLRDAAATARWRAEIRAARDEAVAWLRSHGAALGSPPAGFAPVDAIARRARIVGLGEATHGSRELNDVRLALTRRLVEQHGFRVIALEGSAPRLRALAPYVSGKVERVPEAVGKFDEHWIGRRITRALVEWTRAWNLAHPDEEVRLVGVDPQLFADAPNVLGDFLERAYGEKTSAAWKQAATELQEADRRAAVFGNSGVSAVTRHAAVEVLGMLAQDAPLLAERFGSDVVQEMLENARDLSQFADFNANRAGVVTHARDWYMALNTLRHLKQAGAQAKAVYWGHNAHVATATSVYATTGSVLRRMLGCGYAAVGSTFGEGGLIAQVPNDPGHRIEATTLPRAADDFVEAALAGVHPSGAVAAWSCDPKPADVPPWLQKERPMRWIGGIHDPAAAPSSAARAFALTRDFDAIVYVPKVVAEQIPAPLKSL